MYIVSNEKGVFAFTDGTKVNEDSPYMILSDKNEDDIFLIYLVNENKNPPEFMMNNRSYLIQVEKDDEIINVPCIYLASLSSIEEAADVIREIEQNR